MATVPGRKAQKQMTGRMNVYLIHSPNFFDRLRPCYDASADAIGELTDQEASRLRTLISRYIERCHKRHGKAKLDAAIGRGQCS